MAADDRPAWAAKLASARKAAHWSIEEMARRLRDTARMRGIEVPAVAEISRYIRRWENGSHTVSERYRLLYAAALGTTEDALFEPDGPVPDPLGASVGGRFQHLGDEALALSTWLEETNVGGTTIDVLAETTYQMAEDHSRIPPRRLLADVVQVHQRTVALLKGGRQRMAQTRELLHIDAALLAHACILLGDLKDDLTATAWARTAALCATEADASPAAALSAHAKTARWRGQYKASADLARRGWESSPQTPVRVLLACQEANAAALAGDVARAHRALTNAEQAADGPLAEDSGVSPWSCTRPRRALYALSVALHTSDPHAALRSAAMAHQGWADGEPWIYGTWAQVRFGAAIANVMLGNLEEAAAETTPVMTLPPEYRLSTITNYLVAMDKRLSAPRFQGSGGAAALREQIREFNTAALPPPPRRSLESAPDPDAGPLEPPDHAPPGDRPHLLARPPRR